MSFCALDSPQQNWMNLWDTERPTKRTMRRGEWDWETSKAISAAGGLPAKRQRRVELTVSFCLENEPQFAFKEDKKEIQTYKRSFTKSVHNRISLDVRRDRKIQHCEQKEKRWMVPSGCFKWGKGIIVYFRRRDTRVATEKGLAQDWPGESCEQNVCGSEDDDEDSQGPA